MTTHAESRSGQQSSGSPSGQRSSRPRSGQQTPAAPSGPRSSGPRPSEPELRRVTAAWTRTDTVCLVGAAAAAVSLAWILFARIAPLSGTIGFIVVAYVLFVGIFALLVAQTEHGPAIRDRVAAVIVHSLASILLIALVFVVAYTFLQGRKVLPYKNFLTTDMSNAGPLDPLQFGGVLHAIVGTVEQITIALSVTVPIGLACAIFLSETRGGFTRFVRTVVEAMTALPSIVAGLFVYATLIIGLHFDKSGFAASIAISVMMLPIIIRSADVVLRVVPGSLREASLALGASHWRTVLFVVLPTARSGLATAVILGSARGVGETSPVLLTAGFTAVLNANPFRGPQVSLPLETFELVRSPERNLITRGFGTAITLLALVLILFAIGRVLGGRGPGHLSARAQRRRAAASRRDAERFAMEVDQ